MRSFVSICLALVLAVTFGWSMPARADVSDMQLSPAAHCAGMGMMAADMAAPSSKHPPSQDQAPTSDCPMVCAVGCAVPIQVAVDLIGEPIGWEHAFGRPGVSLEPASALPEAELPPPRSFLV